MPKNTAHRRTIMGVSNYYNTTTNTNQNTFSAMDKSTPFKKGLMLLFMAISSLFAYAQQTIGGVVVDEAGEPLIGVSILIKGTTNGSITDFDGNFTLSGVNAKDVLVFSYIGYGTKEVTVGSQQTIRVVLAEDTKKLDEVVVVGYGQMKKNDLTGSVSSVSNEAITARAHCFFHQIEGLYIDKNVTFADLKQVLLNFAQELFGPDTKIRLRPSYFPFTEPSAEMDVSCMLCGGEGCGFCKHTGWVEILGCGMVDPNVLEASGIDSTVYSGYAFGLGIERITNLKYMVKDLRMFSENDVRFLDEFEAAH